MAFLPLLTAAFELIEKAPCLNMLVPDTQHSAAAR